MSFISFSGADKDMTLDELEAALESARDVGALGHRYVYAELSTSGKVKQIRFEVGGEDE
ncbi:hypothetical protein OHA84_38485 (plasmid) [Streptomyces sp. NBC_00513]|uniref:hypothetical protein n=1 Tax=unclassified Streptomyces TaxID=2593676 RepID=UPI0022516102|nr:hypothetical protein [Streptomyces sp. NBC_00424]MCX5079232.1 hypothetical protein [Streptomyces sp. NBC_00424]WUD46416.1 hypothetical protein OHA84_38485 [Streptomyces sp. NBC_00513]